MANNITWPTPTLPPINLYNAPKAHNMKEEPKRPYGMTGAAKHNVYLDQYTWAKLRVIGKGNASEAIRKLSARNEQLQKALRESQDWNWISAHEYMTDNSIEKYPIEEMQRLSLVADGTVGMV